MKTKIARPATAIRFMSEPDIPCDGCGGENVEISRSGDRLLCDTCRPPKTNSPRLWWTSNDNQAQLAMGTLDDYSLDLGRPATREEAEEMAREDIREQGGHTGGKLSWEEPAHDLD